MLGCVYTFMIITKSFDLITIVVPPALPAALAVGVVFAQERFKIYQVFLTVQSSSKSDFYHKILSKIEPILETFKATKDLYCVSAAN